MTQRLLFPDPRPLVERLGLEFFRSAPECAGVYLMRNQMDEVLYVGKAKNLRKRLTHYRVANPDRMPRRHLRLLRAVSRIELQECADEPSALARESELLRHFRPRFNRAGTWVGSPRFLIWRMNGAALELTVQEAVDSDWNGYGPVGSGAVMLRAGLVRLLWCAIHPMRGLASMPEGWFGGRLGPIATIFQSEASRERFEDLALRLDHLFTGGLDAFVEWVCQRTSAQNHPFELSSREADLDTVVRTVDAWTRAKRGSLHMV